MPVSSREQSQVVVYKRYTDKGSPDMMIYRFRQENSQESTQTSWVRWKMGSDRPFDTKVCYVSHLATRCLLLLKVVMESISTKWIQVVLKIHQLLYLKLLILLTVGLKVHWVINLLQKLLSQLSTQEVERYDITANTTIHRVKLSTALIGAYNLEIKREGYDTYNILVEQTPADDGSWGANIPPLQR